MVLDPLKRGLEPAHAGLGAMIRVSSSRALEQPPDGSADAAAAFAEATEGDSLSEVNVRTRCKAWSLAL